MTIPLGGSIAAVYSRPPWLLDYELASNTVYNATGKRVRELPITLDKLMSA